MGNPDLPTPEPIVSKLIEAARVPLNHGYSVSRGVAKLREAIAARYARKWNVRLDPESEVIVTIGAKEGLAHLVMSILEPGELAVVPQPAYPIHTYSVIIAGGKLLGVSAAEPAGLLDRLEGAFSKERPKLAILSFPNNPTGACVDLNFFEELVALARRFGVFVVHDLAYADIVFDGYRAPSILEVEGAKEIAVELFSLSKSYNMAGWRVAACVGNPAAIAALTRIKSYLDYGVFQPIQLAAVVALDDCGDAAREIAEVYRARRNILVDSLASMGWRAEKPRGGMFVWAPIPERFRASGSLEFSRLLLTHAKVAVSPGIGFGEAGDGYVRFALVEDEQRIRQAARGVKAFLSGAGGGG